MKDIPDLDTVAAEVRDLLARVRTLMLATATPEGAPEASYAPFVGPRDGAFYVYPSDLARHTRNLLDRGEAGVLLIEDEADARQLFARRRLALRCAVESVPRDAPHGVEVLDAFEERFGAVMGLIRPLGDFRLLRLTPREGSYVRGFGQAFECVGGALDRFRHVDEATVRRRTGRGERDGSGGL